MKAGKGFTLVEILIVVVILGILASIVIPQFTDAADEARTSSLMSNLQSVRGQIELYEIREGGFPATLQALVDDGYMQSIPTEPFGGSWTYTAATGVLTSSTDPNL